MIEHGEAAEAVRVLERSAALSGRNPAVLGVLVRAYARAGRSTEALRVLGELTRRREAGYVPAAAFVNAYLGLGDYERALEWLDRAFDERSKILLTSEGASLFRSLAKRPALCSPAAAHEFPQVIAGVSGECARSSPVGGTPSRFSALAGLQLTALRSRRVARRVVRSRLRPRSRTANS